MALYEHVSAKIAVAWSKHIHKSNVKILIRLMHSDFSTNNGSNHRNLKKHFKKNFCDFRVTEFLLLGRLFSDLLELLQFSKIILHMAGSFQIPCHSQDGTMKQIRPWVPRPQRS